MKKLLTLAFILSASTASSDGLTSLGLDDPEVLAPSSNWSGAYVGLSFGRNTTTTRSTRTWEEVTPGFDFREATCTRVGNTHEGNKCRIDQTMWDALSFASIANPWSTAPFKLNDGSQTGQLAKYLTEYHGLWLGDTAGSHTWNIGQHVPDVAALNAPTGQDAVLSVTHQFKADVVTQMSESITSIESMDEFGAFAGYRHDFGKIIGGVELGMIGDLASLEAQAGLDLGRVLPYVFAGAGQYDGESGTVFGAGADLKIGQRLRVGIKHTVGEFDNVDVESTALRVAFKF